jgi:dienelactone hydrolase
LPGPYPVGVLRHPFARPAPPDGQGQRSIDLVAWYPAAESARSQPLDPALAGAPNAPGRVACAFPVIVFSHGYLGAPDGYSCVTAHLAGEGFVVLALHHPDALDTQNTSDLTTVSPDPRVRDVSYLLDQLPALNAEAGSPLRGLLDIAHIGVAGHSFGGLTAELVAARDRRPQAALSMAPGWGGSTLWAETIAAPTLLMVGDHDNVIWPSDVRLFYHDLSNATPHGLLTLLGGGHGAFGNGCAARPGDCEIVLRYSAAFFLVYLAGERSLAPLFDPAHVSDPRFTLATVRMP